MPSALRVRSDYVLFRSVVLGEPSPDATGGIVDQSDELTCRTALFQPAERGAVLHHQLSARATEARLSRAGSADATKAPWSSISAVSIGSPGNPLGPGVRRPAWVRNPHNAGAHAPKSSARTAPPAIRGRPRSRCTSEPSPRSRIRSSIRRTWRSVTFRRSAAATCERFFCLTSCKTFNRSRSRWLNAIRSVPSALGYPWKRTFLLCTNRTFSLCGDKGLVLVDLISRPT